MGNCNTGKSKGKSHKEITIAIFGLDDAGKTTTIRLLKKDKTDVVPTLGYQNEELIYDSQPIKIIDLGGGKHQRGLWKHYTAESFGYIFVIDASNDKRLEESKNEFFQLTDTQNVTGKPVLIFANKQDKTGALSSDDLTALFKIEEHLMKNKTPFRVNATMAISFKNGKTDKAIIEGFHWLIETINDQYEFINKRVEADIKEQKQREEKERKERMERIRIKREQEKMDQNQNDENDEVKGDPFKPINQRKGDNFQ